MFHLTRISFTVILLPFLFIACSKEVCNDSPSNSTVSDSIGTHLDEIILAEKQVKFSGSVLVSEYGSIVLNKSYSYERANSDCQVNHGASYWIASVSKSFCAVAILRLYEQGSLELDKPISSYVRDVPSEKKDITIHQLLTHTSGLGDSYAAEGISVQKDALKKLLETDMVGTPGQGYAYSNAGYQLLAIIVEVLAGTSYEVFIAEQIIVPLGLRSTGLAGDQQLNNVLTMTKRGRGSKRKASGNPQLWNTDYGYKGSTGILSNADDLLAWNLALHENRIISAETSKLLFEPHVSKGDDIFYGYGWNVFDSDHGRVIVHSGDDDFIGHNATVRYYPESNKLIVVLSNAGYYKEDSAARIMAKRLVEQLF